MTSYAVAYLPDYKSVIIGSTPTGASDAKQREIAGCVVLWEMDPSRLAKKTT